MKDVDEVLRAKELEMQNLAQPKWRRCGSRHLILSDEGDDNSATRLHPVGRASAARSGSAGGELRAATGKRP